MKESSPFDINESNISAETGKNSAEFDIRESMLEELGLLGGEIQHESITPADSERLRNEFFEQLRLAMTTRNRDAIQYINEHRFDVKTGLGFAAEADIGPEAWLALAEAGAESGNDSIGLFENSLVQIEAEAHSEFDIETGESRKKKLDLIHQLREKGLLASEIDLALKYVH